MKITFRSNTLERPESTQMCDGKYNLEMRIRLDFLSFLFSTDRGLFSYREQHRTLGLLSSLLFGDPKDIADRHDGNGAHRH